MKDIRLEPRNVLAVFKFRGAPGREQEAAEAWAFELTYYFLRGVGEAPKVEFQPGITDRYGVYTCTGLMTTTHPYDTSPVTAFNGGEPSELDFCIDPERQQRLREMRTGKLMRWDGR
jgi:hypothetical protein